MTGDADPAAGRQVTEVEAIAAAMAVLSAFAGSTAPPEPAAARSVWGRRTAGWATGPDEWWASGLAR